MIAISYHVSVTRESGSATWFLPQGCENGATLIPENPFICEKELGPFDKGIRIDYIMFKVGGRPPARQKASLFPQQLNRVSLLNSQGSPKASICCEFMRTTRGSVSNQPFPYSDHEAVTTHLRLKARTTAELLSEGPHRPAGRLGSARLCSGVNCSRMTSRTKLLLPRLLRVPPPLTLSPL